MIDNWLFNSKFKEKFEEFVGRRLIGKVTANQLTLIGLIIGLFSAFFIFYSGILQEIIFIVISIIFMVISFFIDTLDGAVARFGKTTIFGGILDVFCDRVVEIFVLMALISTQPLILMWPGIFSLGAIILCITMFLIVGGSIKEKDLEDSKKVIYYRYGLMERSETLLFLLLITILVLWRFILLMIFAILVFITALLRLRDAYILFKIEKIK
ncbi:hypothetical protein LCGC14_1280220 [marine sediment metagenome]|uniref:CDP-alcohol phosphatidyltransferase family protein n=1 Tax=marine sediment metagenome TaxID=412755 RepID=A0A0F9LGR0_9ZZZZ